MAPAVPETPDGFLAVGGVKVIRFGVLKLARSSRLKSSARNCSERRSRSFVSLRTLKSQVARPGPMEVSRPKSPAKPLVDGGAMNAAGLKYWFGLPVMTLPVKSGLRKGRTGLRVSPEFDGLSLRWGV